MKYLVNSLSLRARWAMPSLGSMGHISTILVPIRYSHYNSKANSERPKMTIPLIHKLKRQGIPISMITAHDYISGMLAEKAGVDIILVGDSLSMVAMGHPNTNEIELDEMIYHTRAVSRAVASSFLVADLPFGSYEISPEQAFESACKMVKKGFAEAVKMEGGIELVPTIRKLTSFGIPVLGHIGLTPQRQSSLGGFKVQGKTVKSALSILEDAKAVQEAGAFAIVLEAVPDRVASLISDKLSVPTIGIGAGAGTSGQVLVQLDMLGGFDAFVPKFLKKYSNYLETNVNAIKKYSDEVKAKQFPSSDYSYSIKDEEFEMLKDAILEKRD